MKHHTSISKTGYSKHFVFLFSYRVGIKADNGSLSYTQFLKAFDEGQEEKFRGSNQPEIRPESFSQLAPEKAIKKIRKNVMTNLDVLQSVRIGTYGGWVLIM